MPSRYDSEGLGFLHSFVLLFIGVDFPTNKNIGSFFCFRLQRVKQIAQFEASARWCLKELPTWNYRKTGEVSGQLLGVLRLLFRRRINLARFLNF